MTDFQFSTSRPDHWESLCQESGALFSSGAWLELLERSFNCQILYASNDNQGFAVPVFRGGPFRIGYLGFPVGGGVGKVAATGSIVDALRATDLSGKPICVRIPVSAFESDAQLGLSCQSNPETVIENLQDWSLESVSKNLRRDVRKAERSKLTIYEETDPAVGCKLFDIYAQTVKQHGGSIRYQAKYFQELIKLSNVNSQLKVLIATQNKEIAGFSVVARHAHVACYLHGGATLKYRKSSPSDLLLNHAIHLAQREGSLRFSLMASPPDQPSLVRYKEKWGGVTRDLKTYTVILSPGYYLFQIAERLYSFIR